MPDDERMAALKVGSFYWVWIVLDPDAQSNPGTDDVGWENRFMPARYAGKDAEGEHLWCYLDPTPYNWPIRALGDEIAMRKLDQWESEKVQRPPGPTEEQRKSIHEAIRNSRLDLSECVTASISSYGSNDQSPNHSIQTFFEEGELAINITCALLDASSASQLETEIRAVILKYERPSHG